MKLELATLPLAALNIRRYHFSPGGGADLVRPLDVVRFADEPCLAGGAARWHRLLAAGETHWPCLVRPAGSADEAFLTALALTFPEPGEATAAEKALVLNRLHEAALPPAAAASCRRAGGLPADGATAETLGLVSGLDEATLGYLHAVRATLKQLQGVRRLPEAAPAFLAGSARALHLNANQLRRALELLGDIRLAGGEIGPFLDRRPAADANLPLLAGEFLAELEAARFPEFSGRREAFDALAHSLLPEIKIAHGNFDGETLTFSFTAGTPRQAAALAGTITAAEIGLERLYALLGAEER